jgi:FlaA1/EpsC-like NDP-sugar epimerase
MFTRLKIVPRWIIFLLDLSSCVFSLFIAYAISSNFNMDLIDFHELSNNLLLFLLINSATFFVLKTFSGIIRYTSAQDMLHILLAILLSNAVFFLLKIVMANFGDQLLISNSVLVINGLCSFLILITYRVMVKYFFLYIKNLNTEKRRVIIYGAGEVGIAAKRTLEHDPKVSMSLVAFIDDDERKANKVIDGIKIFAASELEWLIMGDHIDDVIIASQAISPEKKERVVDLCLQRNIKVLTLPPAESWINGQISSKQIKGINIEDLLERLPIQINNEAINKQLIGKRILVTGAAGSIGSEIVRQLNKFYPQMIILCDQAETPLYDIHMELLEAHPNRSFHAFIGDVRDDARMEQLFKSFKPHYVYHAAAYKHVPLMEHSPAEGVRTNVLGTKVIADLSVKYGVEKFVMISTDKAVNPTNVMGATKRVAEIYVQSLFHHHHQQNQHLVDHEAHQNGHVKQGTKFVTTRFGNVLGSSGSVIPRFKAQIERGGPITVTHPEITRFFMTIPEACRLVLEAGSMGKGGEIFIFDMGKSVRIVELAKKMIRLSGLIPNQDIAIEFSGLRPGEKLYEELLNDNELTVPTHHEKIMVAKVREYSFAKVKEDIDELIHLSSGFNDRQVVIKMKQLVPEFKSNNSIYEELDNHQSGNLNVKRDGKLIDKDGEERLY